MLGNFATKILLHEQINLEDISPFKYGELIIDHGLGLITVISASFDLEYCT